MPRSPLSTGTTSQSFGANALWVYDALDGRLVMKSATLLSDARLSYPKGGIASDLASESVSIELMQTLTRSQHINIQYCLALVHVTK